MVKKENKQSVFSEKQIEQLTADMKQKKINDLFLACFLFIIISTILINIIAGIFQDLGWWEGSFHIGAWKNPAGPNNHPKIVDSFYLDPSTQDPNNALWTNWILSVVHHPHFFWTFTQFTWLTTFMVLVTLIFRFLKFESFMPQKLKWIISHNTLVLITFLDIIVMVTFWTAFVRNNIFVNIDTVTYILILTKTILVHSVIPIILIIYTTIFTFKDENATLIKWDFLLRANFILLTYFCFYIYMAFAWDDPYAPFTYLEKAQGWFPLLIFALVIQIFFIFAVGINNLLIHKFNKKYIYKQKMLRKT